VRGKGSRGGWRHKEGEYGFLGGLIHSRFLREEILGESLGTDLAVGIYRAHRG
jgi:hypothetical protein